MEDLRIHRELTSHVVHCSHLVDTIELQSLSITIPKHMIESVLCEINNVLDGIKRATDHTVYSEDLVDVIRAVIANAKYNILRSRLVNLQNRLVFITVASSDELRSAMLASEVHKVWFEVSAHSLVESNLSSIISGLKSTNATEKVQLPIVKSIRNEVERVKKLYVSSRVILVNNIKPDAVNDVNIGQAPIRVIDSDVPNLSKICVQHHCCSSCTCDTQ